jgi:hypothetical protein
MRSFENVDEDNEEWLKHGACELGSQYMTDADIINAATNQNGDEEGGESEEEGESSEYVSHSMAIMVCLYFTGLHGSERVWIVTLQSPGKFVLL